MRFQSAQECLETFVYVATAQGGPKGSSICMVQKMAAAIGGSNENFIESGNAVIRSMFGSDDAVYAEVTLFDPFDFAKEDVRNFKIDIENILQGHFNDRERLALLIFGLAGFRHAAHALSGTQYRDVRDFMEQTCGRPVPKCTGGQAVRMQNLIANFETHIIAGAYMNESGKVICEKKARPSVRGGSSSLLDTAVMAEKAGARGMVRAA